MISVYDFRIHDARLFYTHLIRRGKATKFQFSMQIIFDFTNVIISHDIYCVGSLGGGLPSGNGQWALVWDPLAFNFPWKWNSFTLTWRSYQSEEKKYSKLFNNFYKEPEEITMEKNSLRSPVKSGIVIYFILDSWKNKK